MRQCSTWMIYMCFHLCIWTICTVHSPPSHEYHKWRLLLILLQSFQWFLPLFQGDAHGKLIPLVALYAGKPELKNFIIEATKITHNNDISVKCALAGMNVTMN